MNKFKKKLKTDKENRYYGLITRGLLRKIEEEYGTNKREVIEAEFQVYFTYKSKN